MKRNMNKNQNGFTLVELLTVIAVVGILLGLLIPALNQVQKGAARVKQKVQLNAIGIGLEAFRTDTGDYPTSTAPFAAMQLYTGSHILAEAMVGRDGLGYHTGSTFQATNTLYTNASPPAGYNSGDRKGPYLELESANAVMASDIYSLPDATNTWIVDSYVLVDAYKQVRHRTTGKQIGMPILYYKANTSSITLDGSTELTARDSTYNVYHGIAGSPGLKDKGIAGSYVPFMGIGSVHPMKTNPGWFYTKIQNPNFNNPPRPYRAESFILQSAGEDGLYGTEDDIFNFDQDN